MFRDRVVEYKAKAPLISIVDDDALARDGICELVESLGYQGVTFSSAEHFLQSSAIAETTCLITDMQMPGLNGLELQEALHSRGFAPPIPCSDSSGNCGEVCAEWADFGPLLMPQPRGFCKFPCIFPC